MTTSDDQKPFLMDLIEFTEANGFYLTNTQKEIAHIIEQVYSACAMPADMLTDGPTTPHIDVALGIHKSRFQRELAEYRRRAAPSIILPARPWVRHAERLLQETWMRLHKSGFFRSERIPELFVIPANLSEEGPAGKVFGPPGTRIRDSRMYVMVRLHTDQGAWYGMVDALTTMLHEAGHVRDINRTHRLVPGGDHGRGWRREYRRAVRLVFPAAALNRKADADMRAARRMRDLDITVGAIVGSCLSTGIGGLGEHDTYAFVRAHWFGERHEFRY